VTKTSDVDVLIPVGERVGDLNRLHSEYSRALRRAGWNPRFIYILDGDFAQVRSELASLVGQDDEFEIVQMSRRFGEASAIMAGYTRARADRLLLLPAYSQVDVENLGALLSGLDDADVVVARRWPRVDSIAKRVQTTVFARLARFVSGARFRDLGCSVRALRHEVLSDTRLYGDQHRFLPILAEMSGYRVIEQDLPQSKEDRGRRLQRPGTLLSRFLDLLTVFFLTRFTKRPLRFFGPVGVGSMLAGFVFIAILIVQRQVYGMPLADRPALLLSSLLVAVGVQVLAIGLVGELLVFTHGQAIKEYRIQEIVEYPSGREDGDAATEMPYGSVRAKQGAT